jgi:UDP-N-acetylmuramoylalanine--D-glutamate ligase
MVSVLREFAGLDHRCQRLGERNGVTFFNDSKGTNTGATIAAVTGLSQRPNDIVLIAGGQGKGADFGSMESLAGRLKAVVLLGEAAADIARVLDGRVAIVEAGDMAAAVAEAIRLADTGDRILLSPACASFDQFRDYQHRGEVFSGLVREHVAGGEQ